MTSIFMYSFIFLSVIYYIFFSFFDRSVYSNNKENSSTYISDTSLCVG